MASILPCGQSAARDGRLAEMATVAERVAERRIALGTWQAAVEPDCDTLSRLRLQGVSWKSLAVVIERSLAARQIGLTVPWDAIRKAVGRSYGVDGIDRFDRDDNDADDPGVTMVPEDGYPEMEDAFTEGCLDAYQHAYAKIGEIFDRHGGVDVKVRHALSSEERFDGYEALMSDLMRLRSHLLNCSIQQLERLEAFSADADISTGDMDMSWVDTVDFAIA